MTKRDETARGAERFGRRRLLLGMAAFGAAAGAAGGAEAKSAQRIELEVDAARREMFAALPATRKFYDAAVAVLIIPRIVKASFIFGGAYGEGALLIGGRTDSYWSYASGSVGFQAGAQETNQALFFMTTRALSGFLSAEGFEAGADAEVTLIDEGAELALDTTKDTKPIVAVVFGRGGLAAGASVQGGKYSQIYR